MTLKTKFLASVRPFFDADKEGKTPAQLQREQVVMNKQVSPPIEEKKEEEKEEVKEEDKEENKDDDKEEDDDKDEDKDKEEDDNEDDDGEKKEEQEQEATAEDLKKEITKLTKQIERMQKRVGRTQGERDAFRKELAEAKAALEAKVKEGEQPLTEEEVNRRANILADQKFSQKEFQKAHDDLVKGAEKADPKFMEKIHEVAADVGPIPAFMIEALSELEEGNGGAVLAHYANNPDDYEEVFTMIAERKPPTRVINKLNKLSEKLAEEAKPKKKAISKVPDPPKAPKGNQQNPDMLPADPTKNMEEYVRLRNKQDAEKRKAKYG